MAKRDIRGAVMRLEIAATLLFESEPPSHPLTSVEQKGKRLFDEALALLATPQRGRLTRTEKAALLKGAGKDPAGADSGQGRP